MTSRKYFLSITAMMLVLFFMFMFLEEAENKNSKSNENSYANVNPIVHEDNTADSDAVKIQYEGDDTGLRDSVSAWCRYTKKNFVSGDADVIVVDSANLTTEKVAALKEKAENGAILIFAGFPDVTLLQNNADLMALMGVSQVKAASQEIVGVYLYDGFLAGGEKIYLPGSEDEMEYNDFSTSVPWIYTGKGTEIYMSGLTTDSVERVDEKKEGYKVTSVAENSPALIWRAATDNTLAFVIYDDFLEEQCALGLFEACIYEASDYTLYPIVNASVYTVSDFALLSNENSEKIESIYSRSTQSLVKEIIWPRIISLAKRNDLTLTCFFNTRLQKETELPTKSDFSFFLQGMWEISAETGISGNSLDDELADKLLLDLTYYKASESSYDFTSLYLESLEKGSIEAINGSDSKLYSLVLRDKGDCDYTDAAGSLIINAVTQNADVYTYKADLAYRSLASCIGYSNVQIDMERVMRPESLADEWQEYSEVLSGNLSDYWSKLSKFDNVTASEAAVRTAAFLGNSAVSTIKGRTISFTATEPGYYLLRTHGKDIADIKNGSYVFLEDDIYLIKVTNTEEVQITVENHN